jgi:hypothetical protein
MDDNNFISVIPTTAQLSSLSQPHLLSLLAEIKSCKLAGTDHL